LVVYLVKNDLASSIKVADKSLPMTSWLTPEQKDCFDKVTFVQANLAKESFFFEQSVQGARGIRLCV